MILFLTTSTFNHCQPLAAPYSFSAKERDAETGLSYFGSRYYSSDLSVWLSVDPMSDNFPDMSPYVYCINNPILMIDDEGNEHIDFMRRLTDSPNKLPTDPNHPQKLEEVVIQAPPTTTSRTPPSPSDKTPPTSNTASANVGTTPYPLLITFESVVEVLVLNPVITVFSICAILLQGDSSPSQYEKSSGKNEPHGDGGRAMEKAEKQIKDLEKHLQNAKSNKERQKIRKKIQNIKETAQKKKGGENHSNSNKR